MNESCFAHLKMCALGAERANRYNLVLNHVLKTLYQAKCIVYGETPRDLIKKRCPACIEAMAFEIDIDDLLASLQKGPFCAEKASQQERDRITEESYTIYVDFGKTLLTEAPMIVIDISNASSIDIVDYESAAGALAQMEPDYNVNMLMISDLNEEYDCEKYYKYTMNGSDAAVFPWGTVKMRCALHSTLQFTLQCIDSSTAVMTGCGDTHHRITAAEAHALNKGLRASGYLDITKYECNVVGCVLASPGNILEEAVRFIAREDAAADASYIYRVHESAKELFTNAYYVALTMTSRGTDDVDVIRHCVVAHTTVRPRMIPPVINWHSLDFDQLADDMRTGKISRAELLERCSGLYGNTQIHMSTMEKAQRLRNIANATYKMTIDRAIKCACEGKA